MNEWVAVVGTIAGAAVGATATVLAQWLGARRDEEHRLLVDKRMLYARFLGSAQRLFEETRDCYRTCGDDRQLLESKLAEVPAYACLQDLDEIRLLASSGTATAAAKVHRHLRLSAFVYGRAKASSLRPWIETYWTLRHEFISHVRTELGVPDPIAEFSTSDQEAAASSS